MKITNREKDVLRLLCLSNKEIADRLCISTGTVKTHIGALFEKFDCETNRTKILIQAIKKGVVELDELIS